MSATSEAERMRAVVKDQEVRMRAWMTRAREAEAEVKRLKQERDDARAEAERFKDRAIHCTTVELALDHSEREAERVRAWAKSLGDLLVKYGQHQPGCNWNETNVDDDCDCEWIRTREWVRSKPAPGGEETKS